MKAFQLSGFGGQEAGWKTVNFTSRFWGCRVTRSGLTPMKKVAAMFVRHMPGLLNYLKHRITNAASEGINSHVARIIANARGLACFENLRIRVLSFLGKLDLSPA